MRAPPPLRVSVPPRPPSSSQWTQAQQRQHIPFTPLSSSSAAKHIAFSPAPTPSKRTRANPAAPWISKLIYLASAYAVSVWLRSNPTISIGPFAFATLAVSALVTWALQRSSQRAPHRPPGSTARATLATHGALVAVLYALRFLSCRALGPMESTLAEFAGTLAAKCFFENKSSAARIRGIAFLGAGIFLLSRSFDRAECFISGLGYGMPNCNRIPILLVPIGCGLMAYFEKSMYSRGSVKQLGKKRIRLMSLLIGTAFLFPFAVFSTFLSPSFWSVDAWRIWPLVIVVSSGIVFSFSGDSYTEERLLVSSFSSTVYLIIICCLFVLDILFALDISLLGFSACAFVFWLAVRELGSSGWNGYSILEMDSTDVFGSMIKKPLSHFLSERKSRKIAIFLLLNTAFMVVEFVFGFMSNSLGLISDACHMLFDCAALVIGLYASYMARLPANSRFHYGYGRVEVLSGYVNAVFLVLVGSLIVLESLERILEPQEISTESLLIVSVGGFLVNVVGLVFFHEEHHLAHGGGGGCSHDHSHEHIHDSLSHCQESHKHSHTCTISLDSCSAQKMDEKRSHECLSHHHDHSVNRSEEHLHQLTSVNFSKSESHETMHSVTRHNHDDGNPLNHAMETPGCAHSHSPDHDHSHHDHHREHCDHSHDHHHDEHRDHSHDSHHGEHGLHEEHDHSHHHHHNKHHDHSHDHLHEEQDHHTEPSKPKKKHHHHIDHNMEGLFLHVLADTLGSVGVVISTLLVKYKGWLIADPACSIFISSLIITSVIPLLRNSAEILLQRVPRVHEGEIKQAIKTIQHVQGVQNFQNFHVWSFTNQEVIGTVHLHVIPESNKSTIQNEVAGLLQDAGVKDLTLQLETVGFS